MGRGVEEEEGGVPPEHANALVLGRRIRPRGRGRGVTGIDGIVSGLNGANKGVPGRVDIGGEGLEEGAEACIGVELGRLDAI